MSGERFRLAAGIKVVNVAFKAGVEAFIETLAGRTHYCIAALAPALPFIKERLQAIGLAPAPSTPEEYDKILRDQIATLSKLVSDARSK